MLNNKNHSLAVNELQPVGLIMSQKIVYILKKMLKKKKNYEAETMCSPQGLKYFLFGSLQKRWPPLS